MSLFDWFIKISYIKVKVLQIALYAYGNDSFSINKGFIQQISPFTNDLDEISEDLFCRRLKKKSWEERYGSVKSIGARNWDMSKPL